MKILAIHNDENKRGSLTGMLSNFLSDGETATSGSIKEGLAMARTFLPDAILLAQELSAS